MSPMPAKPRSNLIRSICLFCALVLSLGGCAILHFQVPPKLAKSSVQYVVDGQMGFNVDKDLKFGPYRLHDIEVGVTSAQRETVGTRETVVCRRESSFRFIAKPANRWTATCVALTKHFRGESTDHGHADSHSLACDFVPQEGKRWALSIKTQNEGGLAGEARGEEVDLNVQFQGALRSGVLVRSKGLDVAAASLSRPGKVWLSKRLFGDEAHAAAASMTALMLYSETLSTDAECAK